MFKKIAFISLIIAAVVSSYFFYKFGKKAVPSIAPALLPINTEVIVKEAKDETNLGLSIPKGFKISFFAENLGDPRDLELDPNGVLLVSIPSQGKVVALPGGNPKTVVSGLNRPHGLAFRNGNLYVAEMDKVDIFDYNTKTFEATNKRKIIDLPSGGGHITRSLLFNSDNKLLISVGSSCNTCIESDERRAAILKANPDGSDLKVFASGLRNSVFMTNNPKTGEVWATDMGRDNLGDDTPYEEVNIVKEGGMYGWPFCYNNKVIDEQMNKNGNTFNCGSSITPHLTFQAHSAPLGLAFFENDLLVSFHGSWNRTVPTGYKVVRVKLDSKGNKISEEDFVTGWLKGSTAKGRPADILVNESRKIYISDDKLGVIYLVEKI